MIFNPLAGVWLIYHGVRCMEDGDMEHFAVELLHNLPLLPVQVGSMMCYFNPSACSRNKFRVVYLLILSREALLLLSEEQHFFLESDVPVEAALLITALGRMWVAITVQDACFVAVAHVPLMALYASACVWTELTTLTTSFALSMIVFSALICISMIVIERQARSGIRAELESHSLQQRSVAAHNMLSSMCDAVVHLTESYDVIDGYQSLATLLLRQDVFFKTPLLNFLDVIATEKDRDTFKAFIKLPANDFAQTTHISLRDKMSTCFSVQLFHSCTVNEEKQRVHIIGVRDAGDTFRHMPADATTASNIDALMHAATVGASAAAGAAGRAAPSPPAAALPAHTAVGHSGLESISETCSTASCSAGIDGRAKGYLGDRGEAVVIVDPLDLSMLRWSPTFSDTVGASTLTSSQSFLQIIAESDRMSFLMRFQDVTKEMLLDEPLEDRTFRVNAVCCGRPVALLGEIDFPIFASSGGPSPQEDSEDEDPLPLFAIKLLRMKKRSRKQESRALMRFQPEPEVQGRMLEL